ncbi:hypothetical protein [Kitasatospora sp. NPDC058046]|uniref:hypothetical protein n=1 Tax=Kitasatospora sp. NPDC058046 TaxID=3346312 RepID=UPI0036D7AF88
MSSPRRAQPEPAAPAALPEVHLDWRGPQHWSDRARECRHCGVTTPLRDDEGKPAHKVCAERALAAQQADLADRYRGAAPAARAQR